MNEEYVNMRTIGAIYGKSSHQVGRELRDCGYRDEHGDPNRKALGSGMAIVRRNPEHPAWRENLWNVAKVSELLEDFGWKRVKDAAE